ncbi:MAG: hypothetical protein HYW57_07720 [Ignavibacteriales bacterium]|nr:hypothetical protein [Ignavibacteriales bacterium]
MHSQRTIVTAILLLGAFSFFNVGMPVYLYLCPMMSSQNPMCDMWAPASSSDSAVTNQTAACCAKVFVADRKTTPFLKAQDSFPGQDRPVVEVFIIEGADPVQANFYAVGSLEIQRTKYAPPVFLLHSAFLL